jgi:hypothetical protein
MSFFSEASLAMIPSGYKTSKVYSALPITGDGDLTFSRSNDTATRVGPDGLIEKVRTNIVLYSEQFDNAYWTKSQATITANATTAPDGTLTAEKFIEGSGSVAPECSRTPIATSNSIFTLSVFAKASERNFLIINNNDGTGSFRVWFNLTTGVIGTTDAGVTAFIENVGNGWFRCGAARQITAFASATSGFQIGSADGVQTYTGDGTSGIFIWGAQMELSDFGPTDYIATTAAAVSVGPVANVPRLDYLDSSSPRLLLEPQRTNLITFSEQFDNAAYNKGTGGSVSANTVVAPDGTTSADAYTFASSASTFAYLSQQVSSTSTLPHTFSIYIKRPTGSGSRTLRLVVSDVSATTGTSSNFTITESWQRFEFTRTSGSSTGLVGIGFLQGTTGVSIAAGEVLDLWGAQLEASAAYASSYIPTLEAAVTRGVDSASKTGISSLIGQTEGTLFAEFNFDERYDVSGIIPIVIRTSNNEAYIFVTTAGSLLCEVVVGGVPQASISGSIGAVGIKKVAFGYKQNDFVVYLNGVQVGTNSSGTVGAMADLNVGSYHSSGISTMNGVNQALLFKTRLSNADLASLTSL